MQNFWDSIYEPKRLRPKTNWLSPSLLLLFLFFFSSSQADIHSEVVVVVVGFSFDLYYTNKHSGDDDFIMMLQTD